VNAERLPGRGGPAKEPHMATQGQCDLLQLTEHCGCPPNRKGGATDLREFLSGLPALLQATKAEERLKKLQADEKIKAEIEQARGKAADDLLNDILKREKANPAATVKSLEDLDERFPNTKAGAAAAEKAKALSDSRARAKTE